MTVLFAEQIIAPQQHTNLMHTRIILLIAAVKLVRLLALAAEVAVAAQVVVAAQAARH
jgi:hypothetical protein